MRVSQGFWETREHWQNIEGNKGTLANFLEQGNKIRKITIQKHSERVWEHGNIGQFWKGTREEGPPLGDPQMWLVWGFSQWACAQEQLLARQGNLLAPDNQIKFFCSPVIV